MEGAAIAQFGGQFVGNIVGVFQQASQNKFMIENLKNNFSIIANNQKREMLANYKKVQQATSYAVMQNLSNGFSWDDDVKNISQMGQYENDAITQQYKTQSKQLADVVKQEAKNQKFKAISGMISAVMGGVASSMSSQPTPSGSSGVENSFQSGNNEQYGLKVDYGSTSNFNANLSGGSFGGGGSVSNQSFSMGSVNTNFDSKFSNFGSL